MAEKEFYTYDGFNDNEKRQLAEKALPWLSAGPKFITEAKTAQEYIDKVMEFSKILYENFPKEKRYAQQVKVQY